MSDAAEVLLSLYERVMEVEGQLGRPSQLVDAVGLDVREEVHCGQCGKSTHQASYTQYFYNTQVGGRAGGLGWRAAWWAGGPRQGKAQTWPHADGFV